MVRIFHVGPKFLVRLVLSRTKIYLFFFRYIFDLVHGHGTIIMRDVIGQFMLQEPVTSVLNLIITKLTVQTVFTFMLELEQEVTIQIIFVEKMKMAGVTALIQICCIFIGIQIIMITMKGFMVTLEEKDKSL